MEGTTATNSTAVNELLREGRPNIFDKYWAALDQAAASKSTPAKLVVVNMPTENICTHVERDCGRDGHTALTQVMLEMNQHLARLFQPGGLLQKRWLLADWAQLTNATRPTHLAMGDWHYGCALLMPGNYPGLARRWTYDSVPGYIKVLVRENGDCEEEGSTALWADVVLPLL